jgi:3,4-dihydroxy 2-butanone 4-phosphate synthase / GTP cyclohydrolase II
MSSLATIECAINAIKNGEMVIVVDDEHRENEGDLVMAADKVTPEAINFMTTYGRGLVCMPMQAADFDRLGIDMMARDNQSKYHTGFGVSFGAAYDITTGISAADRAHTIRVAADAASGPSDIVKPGHVFPLKAQAGGVINRMGHTEASVDLARMAGLSEAAAICEITNSDGSMARMNDLEVFAATHGLLIISIDALKAYRLRTEMLVEEVATAKLPVESGAMWQIKVFKSVLDDTEISVLMPSKPRGTQPLVRVHSECLTGDVFGSQRCDCGWQLKESMRRIDTQGGLVIYMKQEGRGIGLANKIKAYALQDQGMDTVEANHALGFAADERSYAYAAQVLKALGVTDVTLLTNNPKKEEALRFYGIDVAATDSIEAPVNVHNHEYLQVKQQKLSHRLAI